MAEKRVPGAILTSQEALTLHEQTLHMKEADALSSSFRVTPAKVIELSRL
ncbi:hypothetical protein [uncultured Psychromonas sp.]|nr:hypothetical protein [uncultured Psychromonas sp.]